MSHTGIMPWDKKGDEDDELYQKLFPKPKRRFTFTEIRKRYSQPRQVKKK